MTDGKAVLLFPGQGAFDGALMRAAHQEYPEVEHVFTAIDEVTTELFGRTLSPLLFGSTPVELDDLLRDEPWVSQLAIFGSGVAAHRILRARGLRPDVLVGHSLGEISALVSANAFSIEDGARIVIHRTQVVQDLGPRGYLAALSTRADRARQIVDLIADPDLAVAAENHDGQVVLSGPATAVDTAQAIATQLNIGAARLKSPFPFHSPMLRPAVAQFAERIRGLAQKPTEVAVYSPILRRYYEPTDALAELLAEHLVRPVAFAEALHRVYADGGRVFVESGALTALSKLSGKVLPSDSSAFATFAVGSEDGLALSNTLTALRNGGWLPTGNIAELGESLAPGSDPDTFAEFWAVHGAEITALVSERLRAFSAGTSAKPETPATPGAEPQSAVVPVAPVPDPVKPVAPERAENVDRETLAAEIRSVYATALEYPEEVFADDVLLEAELGVDSVKRVELMDRVAKQHGISGATEGHRLSDYDTIGKIVDFVHEALTEQRGGLPVAAAR